MNSHPVADIPYPQLYARRGTAIRGSAIDQSLSLLERVERDVIAFAMGCPDNEAFPLESLRRLSRAIMAEEGPQVLNYGSTEGDAELRRFLAARVTARGARVTPEQVLITTGGMQGLDLVFKLFLNPGDRVVVEQPTYTNAIATIANYEGTFLEIPVDADGMRVDQLADRLAAGAGDVKLIYVVPTFQNPAGVTLSLERRVALLELARRHRLIIVEDDPYAELRFEGKELPSLLALDGGAGTVLSVNTFAKIFSPGVRVGWVIAPARVVEKMVAARQSMDTCTNQVGQRLISRFCAGGELERHVLRLREEYRSRRDRMLADLSAAFGDVPGVQWTRPAGGFFIWMTLPAGTDTERLFRLGLEEGVAFIPGAAFAAGDGKALAHCLRLNFTYPPADRITEGVWRLRRAYGRLLAGD